MHCLVVDDDPLSRLVLENYIGQTAEVTLTASCASAIEAANELGRSPVDLIFLDVEMPQMSGTELLESLTDPPLVVLVTGKEEYAARAFQLDVLDYLVKPVKYARFLQAIQRARRRVAQTTGLPRTATSPVFVKTDGRLAKVDLADVQWVEAQGDYAVFHTSKRKLLVHTTMKALEDKLPPDHFIRVHRSYIVRLDQIDGIEDATITIDRHVIPIGSSYREGLLQRLNTL